MDNDPTRATRQDTRYTTDDIESAIAKLTAGEDDGATLTAGEVRWLVGRLEDEGYIGSCPAG